MIVIKKLLIVVVIIVLLVLINRFVDVDYLISIVNSIGSHPLAPLLFVLIYAVSVTFAIPASAFTLLSGPIFGFWLGLLLTIIASNLGCHISYFIAKLLGADFISKHIKSGSFVQVAQEKAKTNGFSFLMYVRLLPIFPFAAVNYLSGIIGIKYKDFTLATFLGMLPGSAVYVYLGYTASNIQDNPLGIVVSIVILILFTVIMTIVKKRGNLNNEKISKEEIKS